MFDSEKKLTCPISLLLKWGKDCMSRSSGEFGFGMNEVVVMRVLSAENFKTNQTGIRIF